jgi:RNA polymerase sigma-70 factor (ECF subfamily)
VNLHDTSDFNSDLNDPKRLRWEAGVLARARSGDRQAWGEFYEAYAGRLFSRVLLPKLGNHSAAEDALSETFRNAIERVSRFEARGTSIYFWLSRIASNKAVDMHRARATSGRAIANIETQLMPLLDAPLTPDGAVDIRDQYLRVRERLGVCLGRLNPRYRRAIELRFFRELSREACAQRMEVRIGTFDVLLLRALKSLRKQWEAFEDDDAKEGDRD